MILFLGLVNIVNALPYGNGTYGIGVYSGDTIPPTISLINPSLNINNTKNNTIPLNISFSVTDNNDLDIICNLENSTTILDSGTFTQATDSNLILAKGEIALSQSFSDLRITCFDNVLPNNNSASLLLNITLDTVPPIIFSISPVNNTKFNKLVTSSINIKANCTDSPVFRFNITIKNSSDTIASFENRNPVNNFLVIDEQITITELGTGIYQVNQTCADPHTKQIIGDYDIRKNLSDYGINYNDVFTIRYLNDSLEVTDFGTSKEASGDKYEFYFNTGVKETAEQRTYTFEIDSKQPVYHIANSKYKAHFITGNNWIDYEFNDINAVYDVTLNGKGNYQVSITTTRTDLTFNSVGDLNIRTITTQFEVFSFVIPSEFFKLNECKFDDLANVVVFGILLLLGVIVILVGYLINSSLVSTLGGLMFFFMGVFLFGCSQIIAILVILTSLAMMAVFLIQGASGKFGFSNRFDSL